MTEYHYTSNFKIIADSLSLRGNAIAVGAREVRSGRVGLYGRPLVPPHGPRPRRKALLGGLAIYGKIEPLHEVCPCLLLGNTIPEEHFIIAGQVQVALARRAGGWNAWSDHKHCETCCMA
jgi:hypothetical protein